MSVDLKQKHIISTDVNNIILDGAIIYIDAVWIGGSQVELDINLHIETTDEYYPCTSIENAFIKYYQVIKTKKD